VMGRLMLSCRNHQRRDHCHSHSRKDSPFQNMAHTVTLFSLVDMKGTSTADRRLKIPRNVPLTTPPAHLPCCQALNVDTLLIYRKLFAEGTGEWAIT